MMLKRALLIPLAAALVLSSAPPAVATVNYDQGVWFNWGVKRIDVLIADSIQEPFIAQWIEEAIQLWDEGITYWNSTLGNDITFRVHWAGSTAVPPIDFRPDITFVPQGFAAIRGVGNGNSAPPTCIATAPMLFGWGQFIRVTSHEFGHCLGLEHVFTNGVEYKPSQDIMGDGDGIRCPSNLNVWVIERVFKGMGGTVSVSSDDYVVPPLSACT